MSDWRIIHGDCLEVMREMVARGERVDHVITDPPYEAEAHTGFLTNRAVQAGLMHDDAIDFEPISEILRTQTALHCSRLSTGWILAFCQSEGVAPWRDSLIAAGTKWRRAQIWVKPDSTPQFTGDRPAQGFESIATAWAGSGRSRWNGGGRRERVCSQQEHWRGPKPPPPHHQAAPADAGVGRTLHRPRRSRLRSILRQRHNRRRLSPLRPSFPRHRERRQVPRHCR